MERVNFYQKSAKADHDHERETRSQLVLRDPDGAAGEVGTGCIAGFQ